MTRQYELYCPRTDAVELISEPQDSVFSGLVQGEYVRFRLTPAASAPENDEFTLRLTGPGGVTDEVIEVTNVPLSRNTAPRCQPVSEAKRTDGSAPVAIEFHVWCHDEEGDRYTLYGGGPGTHTDSPFAWDPTKGSPFWHYVPTIASGQEQTTYHAIDDLGARSADAPISVQLGPAVDRLPTCRPNNGGWAAQFSPVYSRPGATRRFAVICEDLDGDALTSRILTQPPRGDLTVATPPAGSPGWWGYHLWLDVTYTPDSSFEGEDRFSMIANGARGDGPAGEMAIVSRPRPENWGQGCGWSPASTPPDTPVTFEATCDDADGDPIVARIVSPPAHGTADAPVFEPVHYGAEKLKITYRPHAGFTGTDSLTVAVGEEGDEPILLAFQVTVGFARGTPPPYAIGVPFDWPELQPRPGGATWQPGVGQAAPVTPLDQARRALGRRDLRLVKRIGDANVYGPRETPRAVARQRALAVTCPVRCTLTSSSAVGGRATGSAKKRIAPGKAVALELELSKAQRSRIRRAGSARAVFRLTVKRAGAKARRATVRLPLRG